MEFTLLQRSKMPVNLHFSQMEGPQISGCRQKWVRGQVPSFNVTFNTLSLLLPLALHTEMVLFTELRLCADKNLTTVEFEDLGHHFVSQSWGHKIDLLIKKGRAQSSAAFDEEKTEKEHKQKEKTRKKGNG